MRHNSTRTASCSAPDADEWLISLPGRFTPGGGLDDSENRKIQPVAQPLYQPSYSGSVNVVGE